MKEIKVTKTKELMIKIALILSFVGISPLLMPFFDPKITIYNGLLTLYVAIIIFSKSNFERIKKKELILSLGIGAYVDQLLISLSSYRLGEIEEVLKVGNHFLPFILSILSYPAIVFCIYWWIDKHHPRVKKWLKNLDKVEKNYLKIVGVMAIIFVSIISIVTSAFHTPTYQGKPIVDVIYTSDNGMILGGDAWFLLGHSENDIRQPLFGLFSLPFSIPAHILSELLFFVPRNLSYGITLSIIQFLLLAITTIMITRLLKLEDYQKKYAYFFFSLSFPYLLFGLLVEQYTIALFYLILTIYQFENLKEERNDSYLGAVSTLITSGILFPLITKTKNLKETLRKYRESFISFLILFILGGQFCQFMMIKTKMNFFLSEFAGKQTFLEKFYQYTTFIENIFKVSPGHKEILLKYEVYRMSIPKNISIIGILLLALVIVSIILKDLREYLLYGSSILLSFYV